MSTNDIQPARNQSWPSCTAVFFAMAGKCSFPQMLAMLILAHCCSLVYLGTVDTYTTRSAADVCKMVHAADLAKVRPRCIDYILR